MKSESILLNGKVFNRDNIFELELNEESTKAWKNDIYQFLKNWFDASESIFTSTSGSTGIPKEIELSKSVLRNSARMTNDFFGLDETKSALLCLPASYIAGKMMLVRAILGSYNLITVEPEANPFKKVLEPIDFTAITPYQLHHSAETLKNRSVKNIIVGGGHVNTGLEEIAAGISASMYETYGMTETASHIALRCFNGTKKSEFFRVLEGVEIRKDERNCLVIKASHLLENEIITNDIVELKGSTEFRWLGRADSVINTAGIKVFPEQLEKKLEKIIQQPFFVSSVPDNILENKIVLVIESERFSNQKENDLRDNIEQLLNKFELPKLILYTPNFERSSSNKILKSQTIWKIMA